MTGSVADADHSYDSACGFSEESSKHSRLELGLVELLRESICLG